MHAGFQTSFVVSEAGELFAWGYGGQGGLATGTTEHRLAGPGRVEALRSVKVRSLGGSDGLVAVATNAETGNEEYYTWGPSCVYISEDASDHLLEPYRFELSSATYIPSDDDEDEDDDDEDEDEDDDDET